MQAIGFELSIDRTVLLVWAASIAVGAAAWEFSGTPVAGACLVLAILLSTASPSGALYATCAAIPLVFRPIEIGSLQLGLLELGILVTAAGTALRTLFDFIENRRNPNHVWIGSRMSWILAILLVSAGTLSLVWMPYGTHRAEALRTWRWVIVEPILLFVLARMTVALHGRALLTTAIVLPATVVSIGAIWQLGFSSSGFSVDDVQRSTSTYLHPNNLALYLERAAMLALAPALFLRSRFRLIFLVLVALLALGVASTFSRGALLGLGAGCAVILLAHPVRHGWRILAGGFAVVVATFALLAGSRFSGSDSSGFVDTRRYLWEGARNMLRDFPITGIGLDQFLWLNQSRYIDPRIWSERYASHPHNLMLDSWLSLGVLGLALLGLFIGLGAWIVFRSHTGRAHLSPWQLGAIGCLAAGLGHGLVDNGYFLADLSAMTWLAIALVVGSIKESPSPDDA
jgi:O-antigen ligase